MKDYNNIFSETTFLNEGSIRMELKLILDGIIHPIMNNPCYNPKDIPKLKKRMLRLVDWCKDESDIKFLQKELTVCGFDRTIEIYRKAIKDPTDKRHKEWVKREEKGFDVKQLEEYNKWLKTDFRDYFNKKKKEIRSKNKN